MPAGTWVADCWRLWAVAAYLYDAPIVAEWSIPFDGAPPADHLQEIEWLAGSGAMELPVAYDDVDGSGLFGGGDSAMWAACYGGLPVAAIWWAGPTDLLTAVTMSMRSTPAGWFALTVGDGGGSVLDEVQATSLAIDEACTLVG